MVDECSFCSELLADGTSSRFSRLLKGRLEERFLWESDDFVVVPGIGHIAEGYCLLRTRRHYLSISELDASTADSIEAFADDILVKLRAVFGTDYVAFEHGSVTVDRLGAGCTDHLHLHFVPISKSLVARLHGRVALEKVHRLRDLKRYWDTKSPYIYLQDADGSRFAFSSKILPKQFMRRIVANATGHGDAWDWRLGLDSAGKATEPRILETINKVSAWKKKAPHYGC